MTHPIEKLETIRITLDHGIYCDVTPNVEEPEVHDFTFNLAGSGVPAYMFSVKLESIDQAIELAENAQHDYYEYLVEIEEIADECDE